MPTSHPVTRPDVMQGCTCWAGFETRLAVTRHDVIDGRVSAEGLRATRQSSLGARCARHSGNSCVVRICCPILPMVCAHVSPRPTDASVPALQRVAHSGRPCFATVPAPPPLRRLQRRVHRGWHARLDGDCRRWRCGGRAHRVTCARPDMGSARDCVRQRTSWRPLHAVAASTSGERGAQHIAANLGGGATDGARGVAGHESVRSAMTASSRP